MDGITNPISTGGSATLGVRGWIKRCGFCSEFGFAGHRRTVGASDAESGVEENWIGAIASFGAVREGRLFARECILVLASTWPVFALN